MAVCYRHNSCYFWGAAFTGVRGQLRPEWGRRSLRRSNQVFSPQFPKPKKSLWKKYNVPIPSAEFSHNTYVFTSFYKQINNLSRNEPNVLRWEVKLMEYYNCIRVMAITARSSALCYSLISSVIPSWNPSSRFCFLSSKFFFIWDIRAFFNS